jgi:ATP-dependent helicase/nuclease subunit A
MIPNDAFEAQIRAADPRASTWLSANAGSGKTRVLTDRVARLLLNGVDPARILCLTYTKAAAAEMQNRLFGTLGSWAMKEDGHLRAALVELGLDPALDLDAGKLREARRLFARAIEVPGGLRIQTIHSFCASILRRFPLEAGVTPQFTEMDDRASKLLRDEVMETLADGAAAGIVQEFARIFTGGDFSEITAEIVANKARFGPKPSLGDCLAQFGLKPGTTEEKIASDIWLGDEEDLFRSILPILEAGTTKDLGVAKKLRNMARHDYGALPILEDALLFVSSKDPEKCFTAKLSALLTKETNAQIEAFKDRLYALSHRVEAARPKRIALNAARRTFLLHRFASVFLAEYAARKQARGTLDFDDLIGKAQSLLTDQAVAQWVLFRLDGGIDHILVDEAQDTSPDQWKVIELLAQEFTSGRGARDVERTIFVVGDKKQSIYSFQGADVAAFDRMQGHFANKLSGVGAQLFQRELAHSFRSSPAILKLVDQTFDERTESGLGGASRHIPFKSDMPGIVELWPPVLPDAAKQDAEWFDPVDLITNQHHAAKLATQIAEKIDRMIRSGTVIPTRAGFRPVHAGDFLILVRRRSDIFQEVIRACKERELPIAGADRLKLGAELAVRDLGALLGFLSTTEDDLSLAAALRSPLFGWSESALYRLAQPRKGYLWEALRNSDDPEHHETLAIIQDLRNHTDFLRPYDLIERILTRHDGRRKFLARLGDEAEDGIDEFLSQALAYERNDIPSLTGFLTWMHTDDVTVKRQADSAGHRIRVMTVHGAKGLEAPIVILPDTANRKYPKTKTIRVLPGGFPAWNVSRNESPAALLAAEKEEKDQARDESLRLLYVALTRAQCWLIVAAAGECYKKPSKSGEDEEDLSMPSWFSLVEDGMRRLGAAETAEGGQIYTHGEMPQPTTPSADQEKAQAPIEPWALHAAPGVQRALRPVSPSDLGGAKVMFGEGESDPEIAKRRGTDLHLLLEHLPERDQKDWPGLAAALLRNSVDQADLLAEATQVIQSFPEIFVPEALAEVAITAPFDGGHLLGTIDRLLVRQDEVLAIDFKSNVLVPDHPHQVPEGLRRQMEAYRAALAQVYPDKRIVCAILWTRVARLMPV